MIGPLLILLYRIYLTNGLKVPGCKMKEPQMVYDKGLHCFMKFLQFGSNLEPELQEPVEGIFIEWMLWRVCPTTKFLFVRRQVIEGGNT